MQNFVSAATGMAVAGGADPRLPQRRRRATIGNFWVDLTRSTLYILLPLSLVLALVQASQGVVQNFSAYQTVPLLQATSVTTPVKDADGNPVLDEQGEPKTETTAVTEQTLPMGPAASQIAIKQLGTNGGGFFNVNSAHPFENPTPLSNFLEMLAILLIAGRALLHLRQDGRRHPPGLGGARRHDRHLRRARSRSASGPSTAATRASPPLGVDIDGERRAAGRQHGGQGGPLRHRQLRPLGDRHDRRLERLGQLDARLLHAARRPRADVPDAARRGRSSAASARASTAC